MSFLFKVKKIQKPVPIRSIKTNPNSSIKLDPKKKRNLFSIQSFFNILPENKNSQNYNKNKNLNKFLKEFSQDENLNFSLLEKFSKNDLKNLELLLGGLKFIKKENYENFFIMKKIYKKFHRDILYKKYHKKNLFYVRKLFSSINKKIFKDFILEKGGSNMHNIDLDNFLNFFFGNPNENLKDILKNELKEFRRNTSVFVFSFEKYKRKFFNILINLNQEKWKNFEKTDFMFLKKKQDLLSICILNDHCTKYFEDLFLMK